MSIGGSLNGHGLNKVALHGSPIQVENVYIVASIAAIIFSGSLDARASNAILGDGQVPITFSGAETGATVNSSSAGTALVDLDSFGSLTVSPVSGGLSLIDLDAFGSGTVSSSSDGVAEITFSGNGSLTISSSSEGVALIDLDAYGDMCHLEAVVAGGMSVIDFNLTGSLTTSSGSAGIAEITFGSAEGVTVSPGSEGVATITVEGVVNLYVWTYLYNDGIATITISGAVNTRSRPSIPDTFYPAFDRFLLSPGVELDRIHGEEATMDVRRDRALAKVDRDADTMRVKRDRNRMDVPQEESP